MPATITYAIGDIHGEAGRLRQLHNLIFERHPSRFEDAAIRIVHLGDYVDRGPDSCDVVCAIMELETRGDCEIVSLRGNHEQMLLNAMSGATDTAMQIWRQNGGEETLESYQKRGYSSVLAEHVDWMEALPTLYSDEASKSIYVHAGIDVETFPNCAESVRLWTRSPSFFDTDRWNNCKLRGWRVVHGHTPTDDFFPEVDGVHQTRINLDTGAVFGGRLTAGIFAPGQQEKFIYV